MTQHGPNGASFTAATPIEASAEDVYALVDWSDERNKSRQMGEEVTELDGRGLRYRVVVSHMPDVEFIHDVVEASKPTLYASRATMTPRLGHLVQSLSKYSIAPIAKDRSEVTYVMTAEFEPGIGEAELAHCTRFAAVATHNTLAKLKANAEHGVGSLEAFNATTLMPL